MKRSTILVILFLMIFHVTVMMTSLTPVLATTAITSEELFSEVESNGGGSYVIAGEKPEDIMGCGDDFTKQKLSKGNVRNMMLYDDDLAFIVNMQHTRKELIQSLKATTLAVWDRGKGDNCSTYNSEDNGVCAYPMLFLYEDDYYSLVKFLRQKGIRSVNILNESPIWKESIKAISSSIGSNEINLIGDNYYSFWKSYDVVVVAQDTYDTDVLIHAAVIASTINAPLVFSDEKGVEALISNKKVITVAKGGILPQQPGLSRLFSKMKKNIIANIDILDEDSLDDCYDKLRGHKNFKGRLLEPSSSYFWPQHEKLVIFNPKDWLEEYCENGSIYKISHKTSKGITYLAHGLFRDEPHALCADSFIAAYLAVARNEMLMSIPIDPLPGRNSSITDLYKIDYRTSTIIERKNYPSALPDSPNSFGKYLQLKFPKFSSKSTFFFKTSPDERRIIEATRLISDKLVNFRKKTHDFITYYTMIGSPKAFPYSFPISAEAFDSRIPIDVLFDRGQYLLGGRIMGLTPTDSSALVMRGIFITTNLSVDKTSYFTQSDDQEPQKNIIFEESFMDRLFSNFSCYFTYLGMEPPENICKHSVDAPIYLDFNISNFFIYKDHGSSNGIRSLPLPWYNIDIFSDSVSPVIYADACSTNNYFTSLTIPFGLFLVREGAKGFVGSVALNSRSFNIRYFMERLYAEAAKIGKVYLGDLSGNDFENKVIYLNKHFLPMILIGDPLASMSFDKKLFSDDPYTIIVPLFTKIDSIKQYPNIHRIMELKKNVGDFEYWKSEYNFYPNSKSIGLDNLFSKTPTVVDTPINIRTVLYASGNVKAKVFLAKKQRKKSLIPGTLDPISNSSSFDTVELTCKRYMKGDSLDNFLGTLKISTVSFFKSATNNFVDLYPYECTGTLNPKPVDWDGSYGKTDDPTDRTGFFDDRYYLFVKFTDMKGQIIKYDEKVIQYLPKNPKHIAIANLTFPLIDKAPIINNHTLLICLNSTGILESDKDAAVASISLYKYNIGSKALSQALKKEPPNELSLQRIGIDPANDRAFLENIAEKNLLDISLTDEFFADETCFRLKDGDEIQFKPNPSPRSIFSTRVTLRFKANIAEQSYYSLLDIPASLLINEIMS